MTVPATDPIPGIDRTLYHQDMEGDVCSCGQCDGFQIMSAYHPDAGVYVAYRRSAGVLVLACKKCHAHIVTVAVGRRTVH